MSKDKISQTLARFATGLTWGQISAPVQDYAKLFLIDAIAVAFASTQFNMLGASFTAKAPADGYTIITGAAGPNAIQYRVSI